MSRIPSKIAIDIQRNAVAGLFAAISDDLPGLMVVGTSIEEVEERLPAAVAQLIKAQYGVDVHAETLDGKTANQFKPLCDARIVELVAA